VLRRLGRRGPPTRLPGRVVLMRGLRLLFDMLATEAILADEEGPYVGLPPRIATLLGRPVATP
jgi:hypothetical protein